MLGFGVRNICSLIMLGSGQVLWRLSKASIFPRTILEPYSDLYSLVLSVLGGLLYS